MHIVNRQQVELEIVLFTKISKNITMLLVQSAGVVEYTDCFSAEG